MNKRLIIGILTGALLGIICVVGISFRLGFFGNELFIFATYFNRLVMGMVVGLAGSWQISKTKYNFILRGALLGLIISFSFYVATGFQDLPGFLAGIVYGVIIDYFASKFL